MSETLRDRQALGYRIALKELKDAIRREDEEAFIQDMDGNDDRPHIHAAECLREVRALALAAGGYPVERPFLHRVARRLRKLIAPRPAIKGRA